MTSTPKVERVGLKAKPPKKYISRPGTPRKEQKAYTKEDRERYALSWILHGEITRASSACGIPRKTCSTWMEKAWWNALVENVRLRHKDQIEAKYENILDRSTDELQDRLANGDAIVANGAVIRVPVKAKELAGIIDIVQSNLRTSRNQPNNFSVSATMNLSQLASDFAKAGRKYQYDLHGLPPPGTIEGEAIESGVTSEIEKENEREYGTNGTPSLPDLGKAASTTDSL